MGIKYIKNIIQHRYLQMFWLWYIFFYSAVYVEGDSWGTQHENGSWSGVVGKIVRKEVDFAATELTMTADRLDFIEFTTPVYTTKFKIFIFILFLFFILYFFQYWLFYL